MRGEERVGGGADQRWRRGGPQERAPRGLDSSYFFSSLPILPFPFPATLTGKEYLRRHNYCNGEDERSEWLVEEKETLESGERTFYL